MKKAFSLFVLLLSCSSQFAFSESSKIDIQEMNIDLAEFCREQEVLDQNSILLNECHPSDPTNPSQSLKEHLNVVAPFLTSLESPDLAKKQACKRIMDLALEKVNPIDISLKDDKGNPWKIRFHFGFTRTNIRPTDVKIQSGLVNTTIKGFEFDERTSDSYYNPKNWRAPQDALRWIDEPSNTFTISIENKKNAFYITAFHPKFLKTYYEIKEKGNDGKEQVSYVPTSNYLSNGDDHSYNSIPDGQAGIEIKNTHLLMNYQIGYGRKFTIFDTKKAGKLSYTPHVDAGVTIGGARSIYIVKSEGWREHSDKLGVQGFNQSIGHRLEYQKGRVGVFVDQKYTTSKIKHSFLDGQASYNLDYSTIALGVSIDLYTPKIKKK
jgi:hypothetical protein